MIGDDFFGAALRHLGKGRQSWIHMVPSGGAARVNDHSRRHDIRIVKCRGAGKNHGRHAGISGTDCRAAVRAKSPTDDIPAIGGAIIELHVAGDREGVFGNYDMGAMARAARFATIQAMAMRD